MKVNIIPVEKPLKLKNDGNLEIVFLGVGSAFATTLNQTNFLIIKGDTYIMVDFGMTGPRAWFENTGLNLMDIETILPTHSHADHVGGIECLALTNRYVGMKMMGKQKLTMIVPEEYQRVLWEYTLRGGLEHNEEDLIFRRPLSFRDYFNVIRPTWKTHQPREIFEVIIENIKLEIFRTKHVPDNASSWETSFISYGLFVDDRIFISGDTRFDPELIQMYESRSEVMFHDAQFFPGGVHASLDELKSLPKEISTKMFLMHYGDNWKKFEKEIELSGLKLAQEGYRYIF